MNVGSIGRFDPFFLTHGPPIDGADARPTRQCWIGIDSVLALPYMASQPLPALNGKKESVPCKPSQGCESGPGCITTATSRYGPPTPSTPGRCDTARQIRPFSFMRNCC